MIKSQTNPMQSIVNDTPYWLASVIAKEYGYKSNAAFRNNIIPETIKVIIDLGLPYDEHVFPITNTAKNSKDHMLSRFACWIASLHADGNKQGVKLARNRLSAFFDQLGLHEQDLFDIRRFALRKEVSKAGRRLASIAARSEYNKFSILVETGYKGLYGMNSKTLHTKRNLKETDKLYDFMDTVELSLHLMRLNLSIMALKSMKVITDEVIERHIYKVGLSCRLSVFESTGTYPENWPKSKDLKLIQKTFKNIIQEL